MARPSVQRGLPSWGQACSNRVVAGRTLLLSTVLLAAACGGTGDVCESPGTTDGCPDGFGCQIVTTPGVADLVRTDSGGNVIEVVQCFEPSIATLSACFSLCETTDDCSEGEICDLGFLSDLRTCRTNPPPSLPDQVICPEFQSR